ncbi:MAG: hypothetical protein IKF53_04580 [Clostridia bacterium]|nr:hypothetical protein [Clostridia bacterium]
MTNKTIYSLNAFLSLLIGAGIYFLLRNDILFLSWIPVKVPFAHLSFLGDEIIRYYISDALWSYSLCFSLFRLHLPETNIAIIVVSLSFCFGCIWEVLQYYGFVKGTGDIFDCVAYGVGCLAALCIYFLIKRRKK